MEAATTPNPAIPFAVLRNAHEGLRAGIKELVQIIEDVPAFREAWVNYQRALQVHADMEDNDIFALLNSVGDGIIDTEHIPEEHVADHDLAAHVSQALAADPVDPAALTAAFENWRTHHLAHLVHEEAILSPLTMKTGSTPAARAQAVYEKIVLPAFKRSAAEFEFFVGYIIRQLNARGSTANPANIAVRVFAHGLKSASDAELWERFLPIVKANSSDEIYEEMKTLYHIETPAVQTPSAASTAAPEVSPTPEATPVAATESAPETAPETAAEPAVPVLSTPNPPVPFALLRNAHEGLRAGIKGLQEKLPGSVDDFKADWQAYQATLKYHAEMEDNEIFALLDSVGDGAVTNASIPGEHETDHANATRVDELLAAAEVDVAALQAAFEEWRAFHIAHLEHEEKVLPPLTGKTAPTLEGRCQVLHEKVVSPAFQRDAAGFEAFVAYVVRQLNARGSTANPANVAVRVFAHGVKSACDAAQWDRLLPIVKANSSAEIYEEMKTLYHIETPAAQPPVIVVAPAAAPAPAPAAVPKPAAAEPAVVVPVIIEPTPEAVPVTVTAEPAAPAPAPEAAAAVPAPAPAAPTAPAAKSEKKSGGCCTIA